MTIEYYEKFEKTCAGLKNIAMIIAIVVGGGWTLHVFQAQLNVEQAKAALQKLEMEIAEKAALEVNVEAKQVETTGLGYKPALPLKIIAGTIQISNRGNRDTQIDLSSGPVTIARILGFDDKGEPTFGSRSTAFVYYTHDGPAAGKILLAEGSEKLRFIANVKTSGLYSVIFTVPRDEAEFEVAEALLPEATTYSWTGSTLVAVK
ncbi:hypothetical protein [uncultured Roseovarius sp.]|uniref:hypothetical protein n=1 Tax=uncultured Roseovarius sp. TaxID=293344 RepID=UPI0026088F35|nr:hypothetical protein [uncultured Roseovarius sp.]